jgi:hypothetical protein
MFPTLNGLLQCQDLALSSVTTEIPGPSLPRRRVRRIAEVQTSHIRGTVLV